jgi:hypothetical protein
MRVWEKLLVFFVLSTVNASGMIYNPNFRIINGVRIRIEEAPYQVYVDKRHSHFCGGESSTFSDSSRSS